MCIACGLCWIAAFALIPVFSVCAAIGLILYSSVFGVMSAVYAYNNGLGEGCKRILHYPTEIAEKAIKFITENDF